MEMTVDTTKGVIKAYINAEEAKKFSKGDEVALKFSSTFEYENEIGGGN